MFDYRLTSRIRFAVMAVALASSSGALEASDATSATPGPKAAQAAHASVSGSKSKSAKALNPSAGSQPSSLGRKSSTTGSPMRYVANPMSRRAELYYNLMWGVDSLKVKYAEAGEVIRFSYRVLDAEKAKTLNDKRNEPSLIDSKAGVKLVVPSLEKVGKLRQSSAPEEGKVYWMAFSNRGRLVKPGDRVNVVIGKFQANRLVVE